MNEESMDAAAMAVARGGGHQRHYLAISLIRLIKITHYNSAAAARIETTFDTKSC